MDAKYPLTSLGSEFNSTRTNVILVNHYIFTVNTYEAGAIEAFCYGIYEISWINLQCAEKAVDSLEESQNTEE